MKIWIVAIIFIVLFYLLGSVFINYGGMPVPPLPYDHPCHKVEMEATQVCFEDSYVQFNLENKGKLDIQKLSLWITGSNETEIVNLENQNFDTFFNISYNREFDTIKRIQFIPHMQHNGNYDLCLKRVIEKLNVTKCG